MTLSQLEPDMDNAPEDRAQAIRDTLRDAIADRRLTPGTKLSEPKSARSSMSAVRSYALPCRC